MEGASVSPFREVEHTADWALHVWAPGLAELFVDAARGMLALAGHAPLAGEPAAGAWRPVRVSAGDAEALLVVWLQEVLYLLESEGLACDHYRVLALAPTELQAEVAARPARLDKVIKAVTYHNLAIRQTPAGYEVTLVFDV
jgi:SHS2 domain-containing protein